jgi:hypothetical protein
VNRGEGFLAPLSLLRFRMFMGYSPGSVKEVPAFLDILDEW